MLQPACPESPGSEIDVEMMLRHGLLGQMDRNETKDVRWAFDYWRLAVKFLSERLVLRRAQGAESFREFASLQYGPSAQGNRTFEGSWKGRSTVL